MQLSVRTAPDGVTTRPGWRVVYDIENDRAHFGAAAVKGPAVVWELDGTTEGAALSVSVDLDPDEEWLVRCDRIDFPPQGVAYRHTHPGPGIRVLLHGGIRIESEGLTHEYGALDAWFETGPEPVFAEAAATDTAFVRVMVLPREWEGRRTIRYVDPADADRPKRQRATVYFDQPIDVSG